MSDKADGSEPEGVSPSDFLRAMLRLSPEDAAKARANSPAARRRRAPEGADTRLWRH